MSVPPAAAAPQRPVVSEAWLLRRYQREGDGAAREELVARLMPLVRRVALTYSARGHEDDLHQVALLGLTKAIDRYNAEFGVPLRTYAVPTMLGEVRRYLRDHSWAVRVPRPLQERVLAITKATGRLTTQDGRSPTPHQLATELNMSVEDVLEGLQAGSSYSAASLEAPSGAEDGDQTLGDAIGVDDARLERADELASLRGLGDVLDDRDRRVLYLRFVEDRTQTDIAGAVGCSQMQVSRILRRALARLQERAAVQA